MNNNPLVSIIIRTKDRPKLLKRALQSIAEQTYRPIEVVLVNDGGCDLDIEELKTILGDVSLNYIRLEKNAGRAHAGNVGIENAKGNYIGFLDDDDEFYPKHVVTLVSFLEQSDYEVAYTDSLMVYKEYNPDTHELDDTARREVIFSHDFNYDRLLFENYTPFMCLLFRRKPLVTSGGFDDRFDLYEDWDLLIRIGKEYPFYHIKQITANYNQWSADYQISQVDKDPDFLRQAYLKVLSRHIDKITPDRIHDYMSGYVHTRNLLKGVSNEREHYRNITREKESQIAGLDAELKENVSRLHAFSDEIKRRDVQIDALNTKLNERELQTNNLIAEFRERTPQIDFLSDELKKRDGQIDALNTKLNEREIQTNNLIAEFRERTPQIDFLSDELKKRDGQIDTLNATLKEREIQTNNLIAELREKSSRVEALVSKLKDKDSQVEMFGSKVRERTSQIEILSAELRERASQIEILSAELRERTSRVQTLSVELRDKDARLTILQENLKYKETLISAMKNTKGWKVLEKYRKIRDRIFLPSSSRRIQCAPPKKMVTGLQRNFEEAPDLRKQNNALSFEVINNPIPAKVSVIIPTKDAGDEFDYTLRRITRQEGVGEIELVIIDSGSKDKTVDLSKYYSQKVFQIPPAEFHHARTRNLGAEKATGDFLVFTVQDAVPVGDNWLYKLIYPVYNGQASAVSARQIPRADADLFACWAMWLHTLYLGYNHDRIISSAVAKDFDNLDLHGKRAMASLDSVCLAIKKSTFDSYLFNSGYAEDVDLGIRLIKDDHTLLFQSSNAIIHSHNRPAMYFLKRGYADTVSLWDILKIERKSVPVEHALETLGYLYSILKTCVFTLGIDCEMKKDPLVLVHSFLENFEKRMTVHDPSLQPTKGDPLLDNFFGKVTARNHEQIAVEIFAAFKGSVLSFSDFMKCFTTVDDVKEDFLKSMYKLFSSGAGNYLGANTRDKIDSLTGGI
jgi:glycosyltransferase involved in cell wall biosynthesis